MAAKKGRTLQDTRSDQAHQVKTMLVFRSIKKIDWSFGLLFRFPNTYPKDGTTECVHFWSHRRSCLVSAPSTRNLVVVDETLEVGRKKRRRRRRDKTNLN